MSQYQSPSRAVIMTHYLQSYRGVRQYNSPPTMRSQLFSPYAKAVQQPYGYMSPNQVVQVQSPTKQMAYISPTKCIQSPHQYSYLPQQSPQVNPIMPSNNLAGYQAQRHFSTSQFIMKGPGDLQRVYQS